MSILIIGAGQAGLAMAYHLQQHGLPCTLIDAQDRVGDAWRKRWDSLKLFSPARYSSLPGWAMPVAPMHLASKDEVADYLEEYARRFSFDLRLGSIVESVSKPAHGFQLSLRRGETHSTLHADILIVANGAFATPYFPRLEGLADAGIFQIHTSQYKNPAQLPDGPALVVGTGASGVQIARELSATRKVYLSGPETKHLPRRFLGKDIYWWLYTTGAMNIRRDSWLGRKMLRQHTGADQLIGESLRSIVAEAGLIRRGMLTGFENGRPKFANGEVADDVCSIVWATGYRNNYSWLKMPVCDALGHPRQRRGVALDVPGLYFLGLKFMYRADSANIAGVGRDAAYIAEQIARELGKSA